MKEHSGGPIRGNRCIDRTLSNLPGIRVVGTLPPLETDREDGGKARRSDHKIAFISADIPKAQTFEWLSYQYRYYNTESERKYGR